MSAGSDAAIQAALYYWMNRQNNKTPNFYNVPPTPSEEWLLEKQKGLLDYSPARDYVSSYANQFLQGVNTNPEGFKFMSPELQGQPFAGGIKMPTIDFSKMPEYWKPGYKPPSKTNAADNFTGNTPGGTAIDRGPRIPVGSEVGDGGKPAFGDTIADALTRQNPRTSAGAAYGDQFPGTTGSASGDLPPGMNYSNNPMFQGLFTKAGDYLRANPNLGWDAAKAGLTAIFGPLGGVAAQLAEWAWNHLRPGANTTPPPATPGRAGGQGGT